MPIWVGACELQHDASLSQLRSEENKRQSPTGSVYGSTAHPHIHVSLYFGSCWIDRFGCMHISLEEEEENTLGSRGLI